MCIQYNKSMDVIKYLIHNISHLTCFIILQFPQASINVYSITILSK